MLCFPKLVCFGITGLYDLSQQMLVSEPVLYYLDTVYQKLRLFYYDVSHQVSHVQGH